jgi:hypothetical protein
MKNTTLQGYGLHIRHWYVILTVNSYLFHFFLKFFCKEFLNFFPLVFFSMLSNCNIHVLYISYAIMVPEVLSVKPRTLMGRPDDAAHV